MMNTKQLVTCAWVCLCAGSLFFSGVRSALAGAKEGGSSVDVMAMLSAHNAWRAKAGVPALRWSSQLAAAAQRWAEHLAASGCAQTSSGSGYGENMYWSSPVMWSDGTQQVSRKQPQDVVASWGKEAADYNYADNSCQAVCGNYTQLVWKDTKTVGCGMAVCADKAQIWVCNYDPAGNLIGRKPY